MIAGVVLAAGRGTRFEGDKVLAALDGTAIVRHVVDRLTDAGLAPLIVVGGASAEGVRRALDGSGARVVINPCPDDGLSASLTIGVAALPPDVDAFVVALGDQPGIDATVVRRLTDAWRDSHASAVVPVYRTGRGNPVLFDRSMRSALSGLAGDAGARDLLASMGDRVSRVAVNADAPRDVDTRDDLRDIGG